MFFKIFKVFFFIFLLIYQKPLYSKKNDINDFNLNDLSNYFSAQVSYDNQKNIDSLKFFNLSKSVLNEHEPYLKKYIFSLILEEKINPAIKELKSNQNKKNSDFFEAYLLLIIDSIVQNDLKKTKEYLYEMSKFNRQSNLNYFIYESLENFIYLFENKKIPFKENKFKSLSLINKAFHSCYLSEKDSEKYFLNLFNVEDFDYSRYFFFYINDLIKKNKFTQAKKFVDQINILSSNLLVIQTKNWVDEEKYERFNQIFSCKNESHILSEYFFLIANLYSTQENFKMSNFYLNLSSYLNKKFKFNLTLLSENFFKNKNYVKCKKILNYFNRKDDIYYWYKVKTNTKIISEQKGKEDSFKFINSELKKFKKPSVKILFDMGNIAKNFKKYEIAVSYYDNLLSKINSKTESYAEILFRRGSSYERLGEYEKSDEDLLNSLKINPDDAYVLNYLAYSWLERNHKIDDSIKMLEKAHLLKKNDPFILDSVGWAYYLIGDTKKAEYFLKKAIQIMPNDPVVNDHYGDVLWKLNRKIQAKYYWQSVLSFEKTEEDMKKKINIKLLKGLNKI